MSLRQPKSTLTDTLIPYSTLFRRRAMPDRINREDFDVDEEWAAFESEDPVALTLRVLAPDEALMASAPFASLIRVWLDRRSDAGPPDCGAFDFAEIGREHV